MTRIRSTLNLNPQDQDKTDGNAMKPLYEMEPEEQTEFAEQKLANIYQTEQLQQMVPLISAINKLKKEKNALILGHNYMRPEVFWGVSDYIGDSFALAQKSTQVYPEMILFNGVYFMAESAKILNPATKVLIADTHASCSLVKGMSREDLIELKGRYPNVPVVTYINSSADVKAESDVICTSSNAHKIVESMDSEQVIFVPDQYLAANVAQHTTKKIIPFGASCRVHEQFTKEQILQQREQVPDLVALAHPECPVDVTEEADIVGSTAKMIQWAEGKVQGQQAMFLTEGSLVENVQADHPEIRLHGPKIYCINMQLITLEKVLAALQNEQYEVDLPEDIRNAAYGSLKRMLEIMS